MADNKQKTKSEDEAWADRLEKLLDLGIAAARQGDLDTALMAIKEGEESAPERLKKKIRNPGR